MPVHATSRGKILKAVLRCVTCSTFATTSFSDQDSQGRESDAAGPSGPVSSSLVSTSRISSTPRSTTSGTGYKRKNDADTSQVRIDLDLASSRLAEARLQLRLAEIESKKQAAKNKHEEKMAQIRYQQTQLEASIATLTPYNTGNPLATQFPMAQFPNNATAPPSAQFPFANAIALPSAQFPHANAIAPPMAQFSNANAATPPMVQVGVNNAEGQGAYGTSSAGVSGPSDIQEDSGFA
jgi:hypothetical protein